MSSILEAVKKAAEQAGSGQAAAPKVSVANSSSLNANSSSGV